MGFVLLLITSPIVVCISVGAWTLPANTALDGCIARPVRHFRTCLQLAAEKGKFQLEKSNSSFFIALQKSNVSQSVNAALVQLPSMGKSLLLCFRRLLSSEDSMRLRTFWISLKPTIRNNRDLGQWNNLQSFWRDGGIFPGTEVQMCHFTLKNKTECVCLICKNTPCVLHIILYP